jgi:TolB-like protein
MTETRRLAAIMAVDVVGFSRLMGEDEAGTVRAVRERREAVRPLVAENGGRIVKTMGDGLLLEFPSVVLAVECAVAIQKQMAERNASAPEQKRIVYRIGVNLGDVLIEGDDILGEGVNIAARLEGICEPGGVAISGATYEQARGRIEAEFVDLGEKELKNIARPVRVYALGGGASPPAPENHAPPRLSLVVLPFANLGGGEEHEYFVDGVTQSLTAALSRICGAFVIGRNTAFNYKGKSVNLKQIGRELNVRYVLEGSMQRGGNRLRIHVQLIDAETGHHLWAESFDKPLVDLFDMQDEIVARLARALNCELIASEARRAERTPSSDSMDLYFQGQALLNRSHTSKTVVLAQSYFDRALATDSNNVEALVASSLADLMAGSLMYVDDPLPAFASAERKATKALSLSPNHPFAHVMLGFVYMYTRRAEAGVAECEYALSLDRNLASAHAGVGHGKIATGRAKEAGLGMHRIHLIDAEPRHQTVIDHSLTTCATFLSRLEDNGYSAVESTTSRQQLGRAE